VKAVERVCYIARDFRRPGAPSVQALLEASSYRAVRGGLDVAQLEDVVESQPQLVEDWLRYSEDKRTSGGWAFYPEGEAWVVSQPFPNQGASVERRYSRASAACAEYILAELDYWADVSDRRQHSC
jgi:hypothetical protein